MLLEPIDTSINLADHFMKSLQPALFHRHADFILGHIPPAYSPVYRSIIRLYAGNDDYLDKFVPSSFTTPLTAAAARVHAPLRSDYADNPWITILGAWALQFTCSIVQLFSTQWIVGGCYRRHVDSTVT